MSHENQPAASSMLPIGVLASGTGSNFAAIAAAIAAQRLDAEIRVLICNRPEAAVLGKAQALGVPTTVVQQRDHSSREAFDQEMASILRRAGVELVVMAGFDRLVTARLLEAFRNRVINIHPALLPAFKGISAQAQAAEYGVRISGATVHLVDAQVDHGPIIVQAAVAVDVDDDEQALQRRILAEEHRIFPYAIQLFAQGRVEVIGRRVRIRDAGERGRDALYSPKLPAEFLVD